MEKSIEELKFVADLAHNGGMMQAQNEYLRNEIARLQHENARLQHENAQQKTELEGLKAEMAELRAMKQLNGQQPTVVVNNFYEYTAALGPKGRFACKEPTHLC